jgi:PTH1 family peptidyl-tRNA hydrolase
MHLVVGLGNPGARYRETRHNVGVLLIDALAARWGIALSATTDLAEWGAGRVGTTPVVLAKSRAFMNASGDAVAALRAAYASASIVVVSDDLDLPLGRVRIRRGGGAGGHRGVASVIAAISDAFVRVRIGIGRPPPGAEPVDFVLEPFTVDERPALDDALARAAEAVETLVRDGLEAAMRVGNAVSNG